QTPPVVAASCAGPTGSIDINVTGGTSPYTFSWTGPGGFNETSEDVNNLLAGAYTVTITDANSCSITNTITVGQAANTLVQTPTVVDASCAGPTGSIDLAVTGGTSPYTFSWTGPGGFNETSEDISNLAAGGYTVTITDASGCFITATITVGQVNSTLTQTSTVTSASCAGSGGAIDLTITGGTSPYTYSWTGPGGFNETSEDISNLTAGDYTVTATDANGCAVTETITVGQAANTIAQTSTVTEASCSGPTRAIDLNVTGGTAPYTYSWTGPGGYTSLLEDPNGLLAGGYTVTITDGNGCT